MVFLLCLAAEDEDVILHKHRLYLKAEKCIFGQPMVEYLGLIPFRRSFRMDLLK